MSAPFVPGAGGEVIPFTPLPGLEGPDLGPEPKPGEHPRDPHVGTHIIDYLSGFATRWAFGEKPSEGEKRLGRACGERMAAQLAVLGRRPR